MVPINAYAFYVDSFMGLGRISVDEDLIVTDTGNLNSSGIDVSRTINIINRGIINSDLYIGNALRVYVTNSGTLNGEFYMEPNASVVQRINSPDDVTYINALSNFNILVQNADNISIDRIFSIAEHADKIILDNSTLFLTVPAIDDGYKIEIVSDVVFKLDSINNLDFSIPVLKNVSGDGGISFEVPDLDPLYKLFASIDNGNLYVNRVRETDYVRILDNDIGVFLNDLRRDFPNDKLLRSLDNAYDRNGICSIMSNSVRLNPIKLMYPVQRMNMFDMLDRWRYSDAFGIYGAADAMFSATEYGYRANITLVDNIRNNTYAAITGYAGIFDVSDDINNYSLQVYGVNLKTHYDDRRFVGNLSVGLNHADFDSGPVFDRNKTVYNPGAMSGYASMDIGTYLMHDDDLSIVPFAGILTHYTAMLDKSDILTMANVGTDINWSEHDFDILYDYGIRGNVLTNGNWLIGTYAKFTAPDDDIGADLNISMIHDEFGTGYKLSVSAHMVF